MITYVPQNLVLKPGSIYEKPGPYPQSTINPSLNPYRSSSPPPPLLSSPSPVSSLPHHKQSHYSSPSMALSIARPKHRSLTNPSLLHVFSTSSSSSSSDQFNSEEDAANSQTPPNQQQKPFSSIFSDVKSRLKQQNPQAQNQRNRPNLPPLRNPSNINNPVSKVASFEEIRKNLAEFRRRASVPPPNQSGRPPNSQQQQQISLQELYKRNVMTGNTESVPSDNGKSGMGKMGFDQIRESLRQMSGNASTNSGLRDSFRIKPVKGNEATMKSSVIGVTQGVPVFGKEDGSVKSGLSTEFVKMYSYGELGEKLRSLRPPEVKEGEKGWFSLEELNERLRKLRESEEKEIESRTGGISFQDLRESLVKLKRSNDEDKAKKGSS